MLNDIDAVEDRSGRVVRSYRSRHPEAPEAGADEEAGHGR
jgi:hypothetical protein